MTLPTLTCYQNTRASDPPKGWQGIMCAYDNQTIHYLRITRLSQHVIHSHLYTYTIFIIAWAFVCRNFSAIQS